MAPEGYVSPQVEPAWKRRQRGEIVEDDLPTPKKSNNPNGRPVTSAETRWQAKTRTNRKTKCIEWKGKLNKYNKGTFYADGRSYDHQDYAWKRAWGHLPPTALRQTCSTPGCVNVDHLEVTPMRQHRRAQQALTKYDVIEIRRRFDAGESPIDIAKDFSEASEQSVAKAARRKTYTWVPEVDYENNEQ